MSLLDDLKGLESALSVVTDQRGLLSGQFGASSPLGGLLSGGVAKAALGDLGAAVGAAHDGFKDPAALIGPLVGALGQLAGQIKPEQLPIADLHGALEEGMKILGELLAALRGDPTALTKLLGLTVEDLLRPAVSGVSDSASAMAGGAAALGQLIQLAEGGLGGDPKALVQGALKLLVPGGGDALLSLRGSIDGLLAVGASLSIPTARTSGLAVALDALAQAAAGGDLAAVKRAGEALERARASTVSALTDELGRIGGIIEGLHIEAALAPIQAASRAIQSLEGGALDTVARLRELCAKARALLKQLDPAVIVDAVPKIFAFLEEFAKREIAGPVDALVERVKAWLRGLFERLPIHALRQKLRDAFHAVAEAIEKADLGRFGDAIHGKLAALGKLLDGLDLGKQVKQALADAAATVRKALDSVDGAVKAIRGAIDGVAGQAVGILERGAQALTEFKTLLDGLSARIDQLGIEAAGRAVSQALGELTKKAEELLAHTPLPEPMRPLVDQLIHQLEGIDLQAAILGPAKAALASFDLAALKGPIEEGLAGLRRALEHLVPDQLIASLEKEIGGALDQLKAFDPAALLGGVGKYLDEAAQLINSLDPKKLVEGIRGPFAALDGLLETLSPEHLLAPAIDAWDRFLSSLQLPGPDAAVQKTNALLSGAGDSMRKAALAPLTKLVPGAEVADRSGATRPERPKSAAPLDVKPGDVVRVLGFLPARLHEALVALDGSAAGEVVQALDAVGGGLSRDLRRLPGAMWSLEATIRGALDQALAPLAAAEGRADMALRARIVAGDIELSATLELASQSGPARLRAALLGPLAAVCGRAGAAAEALGSTAGAEIDRVARRIASGPLGHATADLATLLAALDVEPVAADFEALIGEALDAALAIMPAAKDALASALDRLRGLIAEYNPATQLAKMVTVLEVVREQIDLLSPRRLAAELGEIHAVIRRALSAYDPARFADDLAALLAKVGDQLKALKPDQLLGDLHFLDDLKAKIEALSPAQALAGVGGALKDVGAKLGALDPAALLDSVEKLPERVVASFAAAAEQVKEAIVELLKALEYAGGSGSASASASVGGGA